jgi:hypothetical protein
MKLCFNVLLPNLRYSYDGLQEFEENVVIERSCYMESFIMVPTVIGLCEVYELQCKHFKRADI